MAARVTLVAALLHQAPFASSLNDFKKFFAPPAPVQKFPKVSAPPGFVAPEPKPLTVTGDLGSLLSASVGSVLRLGTGAFVVGWGPAVSTSAPAEGEYSLKLGPLYVQDTSAVLRGECARPTKPLVVYEYDASPFCRKVREACSVLDLEVLYKPCPGARAGFSDELFAKTGRRTVPYLEDPGAGVTMFESDDIIAHLFNAYGPGAQAVPFALKGSFAVTTSGLGALARSMPAARRQANARADNEQMRPLTLYGYEASPFVRPVREKLCALALPHTMVNCARGSVNRAALMARTGKQFQVPYLADPNTGVELFESIEIAKYLDAVYTNA
jgi:glutathione S-transferase